MSTNDRVLEKIKIHENGISKKDEEEVEIDTQHDDQLQQTSRHSKSNEDGAK